MIVTHLTAIFDTVMLYRSIIHVGANLETKEQEQNTEYKSLCDWLEVGFYISAGEKYGG